MKAIVFGGSGFLGSHVADALSEKGYKVTVFDLKPSPYLRPGQTMIVGDILNEAAVEKATKGQDILLNFAGYADIDSARGHPLETVRSNILGNCVLLEAARRHKVKRFVFASTIYVYSRSGSFYRASKQACEAYIESYHQVFGVPYTILRFGSLYGSRSDSRNGIYRLLDQAVKNNRIAYPGDGEEVREYIHVRDAALCTLDILAGAYKNQCVILTGNQPMKVKDFLVMLQEIMGPKLKITFGRPSTASLSDLHYKITPYSYLPKEGKKLVRNHHMDLGQGILSLIDDLDRKRSSGK